MQSRTRGREARSAIRIRRNKLCTKQKGGDTKVYYELLDSLNVPPFCPGQKLGVPSPELAGAEVLCGTESEDID